MIIIPAQVVTGDITIKGNIQVPSLAIGRLVVATVLSSPKNGLVLVSMFGQRLLVETNLDLMEGQILNLRVQATNPKVVMKPVESSPETKTALKVLDSLVERIAGRFGDAPIQSFEIKEIIKKFLSEAQSTKDMPTVQAALKFVEGFAQLPPNTVAYLLIPFVDDNSRGKAQVTIERNGRDYRLHFEVETDALGLVESTVSMTAKGISVQISSGSAQVVDLLKAHLEELGQSLSPYGVTGIEVVRKNPLSAQRTGVDVLV